MNTLHKISGVACTILTALPVQAMEKQNDNNSERPNILMIVCEDISPYLGCYGDSVAVTPNLDRFAGQAILHTDMYTCVGVSSPSRYSLITGRYASADGANYMRSNYFMKDFGVVPPEGVKCYTEFLRMNGYYCTNNAKTDYQFPAPDAAWDEQGVKAHWRNAPEDRPFFSIFNLNVTHESFIWKNTGNPLAVQSDMIKPAPYHQDTETARHDYAVMYSNIKKMDCEFQGLLDELERSGRSKNTIVIFYSDNGGPLPRGKREIKDSGTNVPFIIRFPDGHGAGSVNRDLNMFVDIPATVLSLAGIRPPAYMHGKAMYGKYKDIKKRKYVFGATDRFDEQVEKRGSIRTDRYLYIRNYMPGQSVYRPVAYRMSMPMMKEMTELYKADRLTDVQRLWFQTPAAVEELYDCQSDPHQVCNLAEDPAYAWILKKMRKAYHKEWILPFNSEWETETEDYFIRKMWPEGRKPVCEAPELHEENGCLIADNDLSVYSVSYRRTGDKHWQLYTTPIKLRKHENIEVKIERIGYEPTYEIYE